MKGYIYYALQREALADWYFRHALENDSNLDAAMELHILCEKVLEEQRSVSQQLLDINIREIDALLNKREKKELKNCSKEEFTALLGFPSLAGKLPGIGDMGINIFYQCKSKKEKQDAKEFLQNTFGIFDMKSLVEQISKAFVSGEQFEEFQKVWNQKQEDILLGDMEVEDKAAFETYLEFAALFPEQVKETGVYAADLSDKITLLRAAYACDIISNSEFLSSLLYFGEEAMRHYHSWREYVIGYLCGKSYTRYVMHGADMRGTLQYMDNFLKVLSDIECFDYQWYEEK